MTLVVDASVAAKWILPESGTLRAIALRSERRLIAPSLIAAEIGSAIWKAVRRGDVIQQDALVAIQAVLVPIHELYPTETLRVRALELAIELNHPIYDCFYLTLAEQEQCALISADTKLLAAAQHLKGIEARTL